MNDRVQRVVPDGTGETLASGATLALGLLIADCFGNPSVSDRLGESLQDAFPDMVFLR